MPRTAVNLRSLSLPNALTPFLNAVLARNREAEGREEKLQRQTTPLNAAPSLGKVHTMILFQTRRPKGAHPAFLFGGKVTTIRRWPPARPVPQGPTAHRLPQSPCPITAPSVPPITWQINQFGDPPGSFWPSLQGPAFITTEPASAVRHRNVIMRQESTA